MLELNLEIAIEELKSQGFNPVRRVNNNNRFPKDTWRYDDKNNRVYMGVEIENGRKVRLIEYNNLETGERDSSIELAEEDYA